MNARHGAQHGWLEGRRHSGGYHCALGEDGRRLGVGDQLAQAEQDVLVACQAVEAAALEQRGKRAQRQGGGFRATVGRAGGERFKPRGPVAVVRALRFQVQLPAVARNCPLHNLRGALVDAGDPHIALDLFDHVFLGVAIAAVRLNGVFGGPVAGLGGHILRHRALGLLLGVAAVDALGHPLDVGARGLQAHGIGNQQLVRVRLFGAEQRAALHAGLAIANRALKRGPAAAQAKRANHQARVAKYGLRLRQALAFFAANQPIFRYIHVVEEERGGVRGANAVLVFRLALGEARRVVLDNEP